MDFSCDYASQTLSMFKYWGLTSLINVINERNLVTV